MAGDCKFSRCSLDPNGCLQLSTILQSFSASLSEERAWALCFQSAKCMVNEWNSDSNSCYCLSDTSHLLIHKDGFVHRSTVKLSSSVLRSCTGHRSNPLPFRPVCFSASCTTIDR
ncbi:KIND domain-containing protein [Caerostris darwini]|uniref:KIND domain-containing protein n=1 Tax=Caerostris darwini TaxID=1538125 RepID=A0AAV4N851_9ARAC|nr:KIND domain-containing protein [Caerostris darwini]